MEVSSILSAIVLGAVIGTLGRLALPGKQNIGLFVTLLVGIAAAVLGTYVVQWFDIPRLPESLWKLHWSWTVLGIQILVAAIFVGLATLVTRSRLNTDTPAKKKTASRAKARA